MPKTMYVATGRKYREATQTEVLESAAQYEAHTFSVSRQDLSAPMLVQSFLIRQLRHCAEEHFCVVFLDTRLRLIAFERMFRGTVDGSAVHPREVVKEVLAYNASAIIIAHNHPSTVPDPSSADIAITRRLAEALRLIDVRVLDHIVVGGDRCFSLSEQGLM